MSDSMGSEFSPQLSPEAPAANFLGAGEVVVSEAVNKQPVKNRRQINKRLALAIAGLTAAPLIVSCGWGNIPNPFSRSQEASPTPQVILLRSSVETDPANPSGETIKFVFPERTIDGKSPLIPKRDSLSVSFKLKSDTGIGIGRCSLSLPDLFGIKNHRFNMEISPTNKDATESIASSLSKFESSAKFRVSDADQKIINTTTLSCVRESNGTLVNLSLPNEHVSYTDKDGSHSINPAERFTSGKVGLGINRGNIAPGHFALTAENITIKNGKGRLVATANRVDLITPRTPAVSGTAQPTRIIPTETRTLIPTETPTRTPIPTRQQEATQMPVKTPSPTIQITKAPTPKPKEENKWVDRKWQPNETVSVREWWDDMVAKGYISIDATAQKFAGGEISNFLEVANLVPNPVKYGYGGGPGFISNCNLKLDELVAQGQGYIKITSDAYAQIPGGVKCQIFTKDK